MVCLTPQALPNPTRMDQVLATLLWATAEFIHVSDHAEFVLSQASLDQLHHAANLADMTYAWLCNHTHERLLFRPRPKNHYMGHLTDQTVRLRLNPRDLACWQDETYLGFVKKLTRMCHGSSVLKTSLLRYFLCLALRWEARRRSRAWDVDPW